MIRSVSIFAFFAFSTVLIIVLQPGPRSDYSYAPAKQAVDETSRNDISVLPAPQKTVVLTAPDETIAKLKAGAKPIAKNQEPEALNDSADSPPLLQAALNASLAQPDVVVDAAIVPTKAPVAAPVVPVAVLVPQIIAPELRDMSWQTLNALNGIAQLKRGPGQEGSLLNSIVRRSMGQVDGTQIRVAHSAAHVVPVTGNVGASVPEPQPAVINVSVTPTSAASQQSYVVSSGDSLALIAIKLYGSALATDRLMAENPELRQNPNALRIGQILKYSLQ